MVDTVVAPRRNNYVSRSDQADTGDLVGDTVIAPRGRPPRTAPQPSEFDLMGQTAVAPRRNKEGASMPSDLLGETAIAPRAQKPRANAQAAGTDDLMGQTVLAPRRDKVAAADDRFGQVDSFDLMGETAVAANAVQAEAARKNGVRDREALNERVNEARASLNRLSMDRPVKKAPMDREQMQERLRLLEEAALHG